MRVCFDLDKTICQPKQYSSDDYYELLPFIGAVETLQTLHANGHYIIIHTARGMVTYNECLEDIRYHHYNAIVNWLDRWDIPYHELVIGKPFADFYVDDKAVLHTDWDSTEEFFQHRQGFFNPLDEK